MPQESNTDARRTQRRINPAVCTIEALSRALGTDTVKGLSSKEAARRCIRSEAASLFSSGTLSVRQCIIRLCREVPLWLFLAFSVVALCFGRVAIGLVCTLCTVVYAGLCVYMYRKSELTDAAMSVYDRSLCRVIRNGLTRRVSADGVVQGDLMLLAAGDLIPADARLLSASPDFTVTERELEGKESLRHAVRLTKNASAQIEPGGRHTHSPDNMVFAGGIVESGSARAIAVSIGQTTHLAGLNGQIKPSRQMRRPESDRVQERIYKYIGYILLLLVIPLTIVGYLTVGDRYDLLDIVLAVTSLSVLSLRTPAIVREMWLGASVRRMAASGRNADNTADIRTAVILDRLSGVDELVLSGTAALHDGAMHPEALLIGGGVLDCTHPADTDAPIRFAEGMYLIRKGLTRLTEPADLAPDLPAEHGLQLLFMLNDRFSLDNSAIDLRTENVSAYVTGNEKRVLTHVTTVGKNGARRTYRMAVDWDTVIGCTHVAQGADPRLMTAEDQEAVRSFIRETQLSGFRYLFLISEADGAKCLEGCLSYGPHTCRKTAGSVKALEAAGIRVTSFLPTVSAENTRVLSECGLTADAPANRPGDGDRENAAALRESGTRAFEGCTTDYVLSYVKSRQAAGKRVAVLSGEASDLALISASDLSVTISPSLYRMTADGKTSMDTGRFTDADGSPESACATDLCRRRADVIVRRTTEEGGGIEGVRAAFRAAVQYRRELSSARRFYLCAQVLRILTLLLYVFAGMSLPGAEMMLVSGLAFDMAVTVILGAYRLPTEAALSKTPPKRTAADSRPQARDWDKYPLAFLPEAVAAAVSTLLPWIAALIAAALDSDFSAALSASPSGFAMLTAFAGMLAVCIYDTELRGRWQQGIPALLVAVCVYVAALAVVLGTGFDLRSALLLPLIAIPAYLVTVRIVQLCIRLRSKQKS